MRLLFVFAVLFLSGCVATTDPAIQRAQALDEARRVNANWIADCRRDRVTNDRRCFAGTFGVPSAPFQVVYINGRGPFITAGFNTFPGRSPKVRFDNDARPITVANDGGVTAERPQMNIVNRMLTASTANVRYHVWPEGSRDMVVDISGFPEAWTALRELVAGSPAPGETTR